MNPISSVDRNENTDNFFSCWTGAEILAGLIYRRRLDLRLEYQTKQTETTAIPPIYVPLDELQALATDAFNSSIFFSKAYRVAQTEGVEEGSKAGYQRKVG